MNDALYNACLSYQEEWINSFYPLEEHVFSARHERKMKALFSKIRNNKYHRLTKNAVRAIIIAAIILSLAITAFAIEVIKSYRAYNLSIATVYNAVNREDTAVNETLSIEYIPNGYILTKEYYGNHSASKTYIYDNKRIIIDKFILNTEMLLNTENFPYEVIYNDNIKYIYYSFYNNNCIIWNNGDYTYVVNSSLAKEELLLVAISTN